VESKVFKSFVLPIVLMGAAAFATADEGVKPGEPILLAGHPGHAGRYKLPAEIRFAREVEYPARVASISADLSVITASTMGNPDDDVRYAGVVHVLNIVLKRTEGLLDGFTSEDIAAIKDAQDADFRAWYKQHGHGPRTLLADLDAASAADIETTRLERAWREATHSELLKSARTLYRLSLERQKPDAQREAGYQERDLAFIKARLIRLEQTFAPSVDQARYQAALVRYAKSDPKFRPPGLDALVPAQKGVAALYASTELGDSAKRLAWIDRDPEAFRNSPDAFIQLAVRMQDVALALQQRRKDADANLERVIPQYMAALAAWRRSQLRLSYGR
jgi:hypothetical protein